MKLYENGCYMYSFFLSLGIIDSKKSFWCLGVNYFFNPSLSYFRNAKFSVVNPLSIIRCIIFITELLLLFVLNTLTIVYIFGSIEFTQ